MNINYINEKALNLLNEASLLKNSKQSMNKEELIEEFKKIVKKYKYKIYNSNYIYFHFDQVDFCDGIALYKPEMTLYIIQGQDFNPKLNPLKNIKNGAMYSFISNVNKIKKGFSVNSSTFKKDKRVVLNTKRFKEIENIIRQF